MLRAPNLVESDTAWMLLDAGNAKADSLLPVTVTEPPLPRCISMEDRDVARRRNFLRL
jgi:hypothetical protein